MGSSTVWISLDGSGGGGKGLDKVEMIDKDFHFDSGGGEEPPMLCGIGIRKAADRGPIYTLDS